MCQGNVTFFQLSIRMVCEAAGLHTPVRMYLTKFVHTEVDNRYHPSEVTEHFSTRYRAFGFEPSSVSYRAAGADGATG